MLMPYHEDKQAAMLSSSSCQDISFYRRKRSHTHGSISSLNWRSESTTLEASQNYCCGSLPANAYDGCHGHWFTRTWGCSSFHRNGQKPEIPHLIRLKTIIPSGANSLGDHYSSLSFNIHANGYHRHDFLATVWHAMNVFTLPGLPHANPGKHKADLMSPKKARLRQLKTCDCPRISIRTLSISDTFFSAMLRFAILCIFESQVELRKCYLSATPGKSSHTPICAKELFVS